MGRRGHDVEGARPAPAPRRPGTPPPRRPDGGAAPAGRSPSAPAPPGGRRSRCRSCARPGPKQRREAQHRDPHVRIPPGEGGGVLLRLQLVAHPGQGQAGLQRPLLGQELRVLSPGAVDGGEGPQHHVATRRPRRPRPARSGCRWTPARGRRSPSAPRVGEEGGVHHGVHLLLAEDVQEPLVGGGLGEVHLAVADGTGWPGARRCPPPPRRLPPRASTRRRRTRAPRKERDAGDRGPAHRGSLLPAAAAGRGTPAARGRGGRLRVFSSRDLLAPGPRCGDSARLNSVARGDVHATSGPGPPPGPAAPCPAGGLERPHERGVAPSARPPPG